MEENGKSQIRVAETEKYPHVTFFFSGGREELFSNEKRILCPSPKEVATYDLKPEMSAYDITEKIIPEIENETADFICLNFANTDMVGHHGNSDVMINEDGSPNTQHSTNLVPLIVMDKNKTWNVKNIGKLGDVAPTILTAMEIDIPSEMTGNVLIS